MEATVSADLDALLISPYVLVDDLLLSARKAVAVGLRSAAAARFHPGALRRLPRDRPPLNTGRDRRLRLLPLAQPLVLGLPPLPALRTRRPAGRLRARTSECARDVAALGGRLLRPDRKDEQPRFGSLGGIRQWIESTFDTLKDHLSLERHGGRTLTGLISRIARRLLALTAAILHNWHTGTPGRHLTA